jgi:hypothetical protein
MCSTRRGRTSIKSGCTSMWVSLLKQWMTSKKEKAEVRQKHLDVMEVLYSRRQAVAKKLDV